MPFVKGEDRRIDSMIFFYTIDNNILNYDVLVLRVYQ